MRGPIAAAVRRAGRVTGLDDDAVGSCRVTRFGDDAVCSPRSKSDAAGCGVSEVVSVAAAGAAGCIGAGTPGAPSAGTLVAAGAFWGGAGALTVSSGVD